MPARTIVVVEDEELIAEAVAARLRSEGYAVEVVGDGLAAVELCERLQPDLVVLDLMLRGLDGLEVCRRVQRERPTPVLMLTARDAETDLLVGLAVGADDYLTKPFSPRELVARVSAILRRFERAADAAAEPGGGEAGRGGRGSTVTLGDARLDPGTRRVHLGEEEVHLTPTEFDLLRCLAEHRGAVLSRAQLLSEVWGWQDGSGARTVDSHVQAVRRKLGAGIIRTVHGVGYAAAATTAGSGQE
ncbi:MAG TPA: response regulator transcription factor [Acidimicrobiales bacterium]|nr:response regulator transcription factor [Acidimicrobiales bacterium]